jgi:hypothetical protein
MSSLASAIGSYSEMLSEFRHELCRSKIEQPSPEWDHLVSEYAWLGTTAPTGLLTENELWKRSEELFLWVNVLCELRHGRETDFKSVLQEMQAKFFGQG